MGSLARLHEPQRARAAPLVLGPSVASRSSSQQLVRFRTRREPPPPRLRPVASPRLLSDEIRYDRGHCVDIAKSADFTLPPLELRHLATLALSHVRHATEHGGGAPTALSMREAPDPCASALLVGAERVTLVDLQHEAESEAHSRGAASGGGGGGGGGGVGGGGGGGGGRHRERVPATRSISRYLRQLGFCAHVVPSPEPSSTTPPPLLRPSAIENATIVVRLVEAHATWQPRLRVHGAVLLDLITPAALRVATASTVVSGADGRAPPRWLVPVDGILPLAYFCTNEGGGCELPTAALETLLRMAQVALHPRSDSGPTTQGGLWERRAAHRRESDCATTCALPAPRQAMGMRMAAG